MFENKFTYIQFKHLFYVDFNVSYVRHLHFLTLMNWDFSQIKVWIFFICMTHNGFVGWQLLYENIIKWIGNCFWSAKVAECSFLQDSSFMIYRSLKFLHLISLLTYFLFFFQKQQEQQEQKIIKTAFCINRENANNNNKSKMCTLLKCCST